MKNYDAVMIVLSPARRKKLLETIADIFPDLKITEGKRCFSVTEGD